MSKFALCKLVVLQRVEQHGLSMRLIVLMLSLAVVGCGESQTIAPSESTKVSPGQRGGLSVELVNAAGARLVVDCNAGDASVYIDTLQPVGSPPPLRGIFGQISFDSEQMSADMGWAVAPPGAWFLAEKAEAAKAAASFVRAYEVRFFMLQVYRGKSWGWAVTLTDEERAALQKECIA
jgi:hypothetical protein